MNHNIKLMAQAAASIPRVSGGEPDPLLAVSLPSAYSPRERG